MQRNLFIIIYLSFFLFALPFPTFAQTTVKSVAPALETTPCKNSGDVCDDTAIWIHPTDPSQSIVIGDDKNGGMLVWNLQGQELQYIDSGLLMNNVDIRYNFPLQGTYSTGEAHTSVALVIVGAENSGALQVYKVNPSTRKLENVSSIKLSTAAPYGGCMYHSPVSNKYYYFVNWKSGVWQQIELAAQGNTVTGTSVRTADAGGQTEGCVADDINKYYYIGEEAVGVWRYGAEPGDGATRVKVSGSEQTADTEGMSMYYKSDGTGYLIVSSQGDSTYSVYNRIPPSATVPNALIGRFKVDANGGVDAASSTDGLDVTNFGLGGSFAQGLLVVHDASNTGASTSNHKFVPFQNVATALGLSLDTTWDPRKIGAPNGGGGGGTTPTVAPTVITPTYIVNATNPPATPTSGANPTVPAGTNCAKKNIGDADCKTDTQGRSINILDYAIWYSEFISGCSGTNTNMCGTDADGNGNLMDANFNYPGTNYITTDTIINSFDYAVWIQGLLSQTSPIATTQPTAPVTGNPTGAVTATVAPTSGVPTATSGPIPTIPISGTSKALWISPQEIAALPASGAAWDRMRAAANSNLGSSALYNQESRHPQLTLAAALVAAKKGPSEMCGSVTCQSKAIAGIMDIIDDTGSTGGGDGRALGLGRNLMAYVVAADVVNLKQIDPAKDTTFKTFLKAVVDRQTTECGTLRECHDKRPNNWGTMTGASRIAADIYMGDTTDLAIAVKVFKGYIGDRTAYASFTYGSGATDWMCDTANPRPLNPANCVKSGKNLSGALPDDMRRGGGFTWPPTPTNYAWGAYSAALAQAELLYRAGYDSYNWEDKAMLRAIQFNAANMASSASGPTNWAPWVAKKRYGAGSFSYTPQANGGGRLMDWADWTHQ